MARIDIYQDVTDKIIAALEAGVSPWSCPWKRDGGRGVMPCNYSTGAAYSGVNVLLLFMAAMENGFSSHAWLTYKQAQAMGGQVKKGAKSVRCIFYKTLEIEGEGEDDAKVIPMVRGFSVFNLDQIEGLDVGVGDDAAGDVFAPIEAAESLLLASGARIEERGDLAFYAPGKDLIVLPERARFDRAEDFYATATHELTHWTGHKSRLDRGYKGIRGDNSYAFEELVAEIGSAYLNSGLGLEGDLQHASYIENWLEILKGDKRAIFKAASLASKAHQYIMDQVEGDSQEVAA